MEILTNLWASPVIQKLLITLIVILLLFAFSRLLIRAVGRFSEDSATHYYMRKAINFAGFLLTVVAVSIIFSDKLGGLTVALGVAGAGIAFALQEVIVSIAGWIAIIFGRFYKVGHRVQLGGIKGDVIDIGVLRTTLMETGGWVSGDLYNGRVVRIANSFVFKEPVLNYSGDFHFLWDEITLHITHDSDIARAKELFAATAGELCAGFTRDARTEWKTISTKFRVEQARVEPMVTIDANENYVEITLRYVVDYKMRRTTKDKLLTQILEGIKKDPQLELAYSTLSIMENSAIRVKERGGKG